MIIEATLTATNSGVVSGQLVSFALDNSSLATFANGTGSAVTNANGVASLGVNVGTLSGAGKITATFGDISAEVVFSSAGDGDTNVGETIGSVSLIADKLQLGSASTDKVELSALIRNTNNNVVSDIPVTFSTDSGEIQVVDSASAANGIARATLTTLSNKNNRDITVTVRAQQQSSQLIVKVVGTEVNITAPQAVVLNDSAQLDIFIVDSEGNGLENVMVNIASSLGNTLSVTNPVTSGSTGKAAVTYTAVNSGIDTILVTALGAQRSVSLNVSPDSFTFLQTVTNAPVIEEVSLNSPK
ncbi:MAG: Ig-like domain-containing protein, partial [Alishewanella sp.]|nr:Ig-like domain-containing protein [Alishewanella sp.]